MAITLTNTQIKVDGKPVASIKSAKAFSALRDALIAILPPTEAVYLAVTLLGEAKTNDVARFVGQDNSNTGRRLEELLAEKRIKLVDKAVHTGGRGRPSRLWAVK
jgi:predicted ArsR family transcriptional regulator